MGTIEQTRLDRRAIRTQVRAVASGFKTEREALRATGARKEHVDNVSEIIRHLEALDPLLRQWETAP